MVGGLPSSAQTVGGNGPYRKVCSNGSSHGIFCASLSSAEANSMREDII